MASGALLVYWALVAKENQSETYVYPRYGKSNLKLLCYAMCGLIAIVVLRTPYTNFNDADNRKADCADLMADAILKEAGPARCIMTDGILDLNLLFRANQTGRKITFLPCDGHALKAASPARGKKPFSLALNGKKTDPGKTADAFVEQWLLANPGQAAQVATVGTAGVWEHAGLNVTPYGLVFLGRPVNGPLSGVDLLNANIKEWQALSDKFTEDPTLRPELRAVRSSVRALASRMANDLGVFFETRGEIEHAEAAYQEAELLDYRNLTANLNHLILQVLHAEPSTAKAAADTLAAMTSRPDFFKSFSDKTSAYGKRSKQSADIFMPSLARACGQANNTPDWVFGLAANWLKDKEAPKQNTPLYRFIEPAKGTVPDADAKLSQAIAVMLQGNHVQAEKFLRLIVMKNPENLSALALLSEVLMMRGETQEVKTKILPAMKALTRNTNSVLVLMAEGCLLTRLSPPELAAARSCFQRAVAINPKASVACDELLNVDLRLGDAKAVESDAATVIRQLPDHAFANALLGSLRLTQKRYGESEVHLRQSLKAQSTPGVMNDLAELLRQQNKLDEAEQYARQAVRSNPSFPQAWSTLGEILFQQGKLKEAIGPLRCAIAIKPDTVRAQVLLENIRTKLEVAPESKQAFNGGGQAQLPCVSEVTAMM